MLKKIIKYDLLSLSKYTVPVWISSVVISIISCAVLFFAIVLGGLENIGISIAANMVIGSIVLIVPTALYAIFIVTLVVAVFRYYKSVFTDEGYLTMVIPEDPGIIFTAKYISTSIIVAISTVVVAACLFVGLLLPPIIHFPQEAGELLKLFFADTGGEYNLPLQLITIAISAVIGFVNTVTVTITAVTLGSLLVRKHKVVSSIVIYFLLSFLESAVISTISIIVIIPASLTDNWDLISVVGSAVSVIGYAVFIVGAYALNLYLIRKRFNIE